MNDFSGFVAGRIALIQRGACNFGVKVQNAQAAGASGVVIFNEGNPGRTAVFAGSSPGRRGPSDHPDDSSRVHVVRDRQRSVLQVPDRDAAGHEPEHQGLVNPDAEDYNVIAESKGGDKNHVVVVDAHLDAIYGAGMLDNASGSATILDIAQKMKNVNPLNKLRVHLVRR